MSICFTKIILKSIFDNHHIYYSPKFTRSFKQTGKITAGVIISKSGNDTKERKYINPKTDRKKFRLSTQNYVLISRLDCSWHKL
jgi:hypothetical protein